MKHDDIMLAGLKAIGPLFIDSDVFDEQEVTIGNKLINDQRTKWLKWCEQNLAESWASKKI